MPDALKSAALILGAAAVFGGALFLARSLLPLIRLRADGQFRTEAIPQAWNAIVDANVPLARRLSVQERERLLRLVQVFVHDKPFEGCAGLAITEEMRVVIAAHACLLILHIDGPCYPSVDRVLVYPTTFVPKPTLLHRHLYRRPVSVPQPTLGESWKDGIVVLSWDDVRRGASDPADGHNVALHEFAHQLDQEDGMGGGTPILETPSLRQSWTRVLTAHYEELCRDTLDGRPTVLDPYGATSPAEFFAVATEAFFEKPEALRTAKPALYEELKAYYRQDPATAGRAGGV